MNTQQALATLAHVEESARNIAAAAGGHIGAVAYLTDVCAMRALATRALQSDPLTIAYLAAGAARFLTPENSHTEAYARIADGLGETGVMAAVIAHADMIDALYTEHAEAFEGVHAYEVAEPFGDWYVRTWQDTGTEPTEAEAKAEALRLTLGSCYQRGA